jgi:undecaprenyl-diphosphatase
LPGLDRDVYLWVTDHRVGWLDPVFLGLTAIGQAGLVWVVLALVLSLAVRRPPLRVVLAVAGTVWSADLLAAGLKAAVDRPRPFRTVEGADALTTHVVGQSFPSGHATTSFAGATMLAFFFPRVAPWLFLLAVAIAFSRVYIGVHYLGDVLAGAALGVAWALVVLVLLRRFAPWLLSGRPRAYSGGAP